MSGYVTTRHVVLQAHTIIAEFGLRVWLRAVWACLRPGRHTFLECL